MAVSNSVCLPALLLAVSLHIPFVLARSRCTGSNCGTSSLSTAAKIGIGVAIAVLLILLIALALLRRYLLRRRLRNMHRQQQAGGGGFSIAPPLPGATASSTVDGAGAAGTVGDGRYPHPYYSNNGGGNMATQPQPSGFGSTKMGPAMSGVQAPPPSYRAGGGGATTNGNNPYEGNMTGVGGFKPPPGPPPNFDANQRV